VVLTVQAKGQKKAISEQLNSNTIKNVVAADRLQENPDANSVEAIGRLPGVSVTRDGGEGSGLVVRGLSPKYTAVTLNGVKMASNSANGQETNISGISQYALQGVEVYKSLTAEMEANSVAGTINLKLRETPKDLHFNIMNTTGYNNLNNYLLIISLNHVHY
jgi:TonB-dependent receptor